MRQSIIFWCYIFATMNSGLISMDVVRVKRVIHGNPVLDIKNSDYRVLKYFVWISGGHNCDISVPDSVKEALDKPKNWELGIIRTYPYWVVGRICEPRPHHIRCTGSLLTDFLVQTACHCVVYFNEKDDKDDYIYPVLMKPEEVGFTVHPARRLVSDYKVNEGVYTKNFYIHPKCWKKAGLLFHDYALIVLHSSFKWYQKSYAPAYPAARLPRMWLDAMAKAKVCLIIGFGTYSWEKDRDFIDDFPLKSDVLRHGWLQAMNYGECYETFFDSSLSLENYTNEATFLCTINIPFKDQEVLSNGKGDSGGPVTCDNNYIALIGEKLYRSVGSDERHRFAGYDKHMSTAFSIYENAVEYRSVLIHNTWQLYVANGPYSDFVVTQRPLKMFFEQYSTSWGQSGTSFCFMTYSIIVMIILVCFI